MLFTKQKNDNPTWVYANHCWNWVMGTWWGCQWCHFLILSKPKKERNPQSIMMGEKTSRWLEETELENQRVSLSHSQTKRPKKLGVQEIKQVEEMTVQGPAWNQCQWYTMVPFLLYFCGLGSETCWGWLDLDLGPAEANILDVQWETVEWTTTSRTWQRKEEESIKVLKNCGVMKGSVR